MPDLALGDATIDIDHPLAEYNDRFRDAHARAASQYFEDLLRQSGVDEQENIRLVAELRDIEQAVASTTSRRNGWRFIAAAALTVAAAAATAAFSVQGWGFLFLILTVGAGIFHFMKVRGMLADLRLQLQELQPRRDAKRDEAWSQMAPLNALHTWGVAPALFQATFPGVRLDPHVSSARLHDLLANYGLSPDAGNGHSALFVQSGSMAGNPLVFRRSLRHWMGSQSYSGSLVIHWTEEVRNSEGRYVTVHRSQTLTASVVKPCPRFQETTALIYGHEAAPDLSFSREPSKLSGLGEGRLNDWRKDLAVKQVQRKARRGVISGGTGLTVMANRDFEALFKATDRNDEIAFRLLFTPLAQAEMVELLNDRTVGFGDDFSFAKQGRITILQPQHLDGTSLDGDPRQFHSLEVAEARRVFNAFHTHYFRSLYFSLAPLLAIPLYREQRSMPDAADGSTDLLDTCAWEHEAMANLIGEGSFRHPSSITKNLLKTTSTPIAAGVQAVDVTAHGYGGIARVDYVPVRGGDGHVHAVPVPWTEYYDVQSARTMLVGVVGRDHAGADDAELEEGWHSALRQYGADPADAVVRGSLAGCLLPG